MNNFTVVAKQERPTNSPQPSSWGESVDTPSDLYVIAMAHRFIPISAPFAMDAATTSNLQAKRPMNAVEKFSTQNPGGLIRWLTLVHFGTSVYTPTRQHSIHFPLLSRSLQSPPTSHFKSRKRTHYESPSYTSSPSDQKRYIYPRASSPPPSASPPSTSPPPSTSSPVSVKRYRQQR